MGRQALVSDEGAQGGDLGAVEEASLPRWTDKIKRQPIPVFLPGELHFMVL